jgi:phospholipase C
MAFTALGGRNQSMAFNRREFMRLTAGVVGVGPALLPAVIRKALAIPAASVTGTIRDVRHVVVFMQENRSFDHYFGTFRGVRGFGDPRPVPLPAEAAGNRIHPVWRQPYQKHPDGYVLPYPIAARPMSPAVCFSGLPHGWKDGHEAWNRGRCDRWAPVKSPQTMAYYQEADIPFHHALADAFTLCDAYHCSHNGPTSPNRLFLMSGTNGQRDPVIGPATDNFDHYTRGWTTYPERLEQAGVTWQVYQQGLVEDEKDPFNDNYGDNALQYFQQYLRRAEASPALLARGNAVRTLADLRDDVRQGTLPQVSWIVAPQGYSEHPQYPPAYGADYTARILEALTANEEVWSGTVLFINFDENDGFFDHMPPPVPPAPDGPRGRSTVAAADELHQGRVPYGLGARVPMTIVSPWTRGGWVSSEVFDHTSVIRFLEERFGVREPNISAWRRAVCGDLTSAFSFTKADATRAPLPATAAYLEGQAHHQAVHSPDPPRQQTMPVQAAGTRPARPVPYELFATGRADAAQGKFWIDLANTGKAGAVFQVYAGDRPDGPWVYTVEAGRALTDGWDAATPGAGSYDLTVYGPNGFLRAFRGALGAAGGPETAVAYDAIRGGLTLALRNDGTAECVLTVTPQAYGGAPRSHRVAPGATVSDPWSLEASGGWYDLVVTADGFLRRLAGHVETGAPGRTDPAMGALIAAAPFDLR